MKKQPQPTPQEIRPPNPMAGFDWRPALLMLTSRIASGGPDEVEPQSMEAAVRAVREKMGWNYHEMSLRLGTVAAHVYYMEQGKFKRVTEKQLRIIANIARDCGLTRTEAYIIRMALVAILAAKNKPHYGQQS